MKKCIILFAFIALASCDASAQTDSAAMKGIFEKLTGEMQAYRIDTSAVPDDKVTRKIRELRALRGGFNITEAVQYKIQEEENKGEMPKATVNLLKAQFTGGSAAQWLENAVIHIYRNEFTYTELKRLVKFYKTSAGQKLAADFPLIMMKTLAAAQVIQERVVKEGGTL